MKDAKNDPTQSIRPISTNMSTNDTTTTIDNMTNSDVNTETSDPNQREKHTKTKFA
jgi:hypothetical protein